ncbi:hypothetical protein K080096A4_34560 [[Clostridium] innocuum]
MFIRISHGILYVGRMLPIPMDSSLRKELFLKDAFQLSPIRKKLRSGDEHFHISG